MLDFLTLTPEAFGLDISDLSLKIVKLKKKGNFLDLTSFGQMEIKPGIIKEGEIKNKEKLVTILKEAIKKVKGEKLKTKYVVASLPEEKAFLEVIQMPKIPEEDLKSAVVYEAENYVPLPIEKVYLDSQIVPPVYDHLEKLDVLIAALPKEMVDPYLEVFKKAGLEPVVLEIEPLAIARALIKDQTIDYPVLIIDLGQTRTSFVIFAGKSVRFTSSLSISGQHFTELVAKNLKISFNAAEKLKIKYGLEEKFKLKIEKKETIVKKEKGKIFEALIPALVDLIQQIKRYLAYYESHARVSGLPPDGKKIKKIILCGGGANLKGLPELLSIELKIGVELGNPWINILPKEKKEKPELSYEKSLAYTTALGLALRAIEYD